MKFLIDAHLPLGMRVVLRAAGHDAIQPWICRIGMRRGTAS